ncbi:putative potassium transporter 12 isoform X2 [Amaranthus tricolor]|uniref:putative potassium transporter 12 isoform X2 n=1 Tax=Amaranthus tricolor TaxID=29722 RepID=UPI002586DB5D|nr:putative potassium transporter 12 isoform X2 [Amaranthus tricolor]
MEGEEIRESGGSLRWVGSGPSKWVDGSEVSSEEIPFWSKAEEDEFRNRYGSSSGSSHIKRRLVKKPKRVDSFDVEAMEIAGAHHHHTKELSTWRTLALAFQTLGVVYGDLGTSPLYVFTDVFSKVPITSEVDILGALSVILYTITLVPLAKYVFVVLKANDNGEGGTFALYSLITRYANVSVLPNRQQADQQISSYRLKLPTPELERALNIKEVLERKSFMKTLLLLLVLTGTSLIIGDGILTPAMSVMSAVSGLQGEINEFGTSGLFWPIFVIATLAAVIASQAMISATFSVIKQAMALGCFPRLKVIHTSKRLMGQIYIPIINWFLMVMCLIVVATFRSTTDIANAYGIAEVGVMLVSTALVTLVMLLIWQTNIFLALSFPVIFGTIELIYLSAVLSKIMEGGWLPLVFAACFLLVMETWNYGSVLKYQCEVRDKISIDIIHDLGSSLGTVRVPGIGLVYNELVNGIPSILGQFILSLPAIHSTIIFVCIKYVPVPVVPQEERFLFRRICPKDYHMFRCIARYGYKDVRKEDHHSFEQLLVVSLKNFLKNEAQDLALESDMLELDIVSASVRSRDDAEVSDELRTPLMHDQRFVEPARLRLEENEELPSSAMSSEDDPSLEYELSALREAVDSGFTYLLGDGDVRAKKESWFLKKLVINYFYAFLRRNCRRGAAVLRVPHMNIIEVGMTYMV